MIRAGQLDRQITIQSPTFQKNETGEEETVWNDFATVWAQVKPVTGKEPFMAGQVNTQITTSFVIRRLDGLNEEMEIQYNGQHYNIEHLAEINRNEGQRILASVKVYQ